MCFNSLGKGLFLLFWCLNNLMIFCATNEESFIIPLLMPNVKPMEKETYLCTAFKMHSSGHRYIVEFKPNSSMNIAHHILIYGCALPGYHERDTPSIVWDCGEMTRTANSRQDYVRAGTCASGSQVVYAWALDAPPLVLPDGVGFKVGGDSGINYLVLQVHYARVDKFLNGGTDDSGIFLKLLPETTQRVNKRAGVLLMATGGVIPEHSVEHMETACAIDEPLEIHPFAFRTHAHKLGRVVSGFLVSPERHWTLIGRHNPQKPQMFYPVKSKDMVIRENDVVAARCTMNNNLSHPVWIGQTADDEMCNFYMMYYVNGDRILERKYCNSEGPPRYYWTTDSLVSSGGSIPESVDREASRLSPDEQ